VLTISTCAETNPQVATTLKSLQGLDENAVVKELAKFLDSDRNTVRRSAIYILWKGNFKSIEPAVSSLQKLCSHEEEYARGMAAIALGAGKVKSSFDSLCDMTLKDSSSYARRCAAYALGLMSRAEAKPILEQALKDSDFNVRNNAEASLTMLLQASKSKSTKPVVVSTNPVAFSNDVSPELKKITVTFDQRMMDGSWSWTGGGETFPKRTGAIYYDDTGMTCTMPVKLEPGKVYRVGINSPSHKNFKTPQHTPARRYVILFATKDKAGKPTPIPDNLIKEATQINSRSEENKSPGLERHYTQMMFNDIQPDGTILFKATIKRVNQSGREITNTSFVNSDFVHVTGMSDAKGNPMEFTSMHDGDIYRYKLTFNEPILPDEVMEYSHEGRITELIKRVPGKENQFRYFMTHWPAAGQPTRRIETYLLPKGAELISTTPGDMERRTRNGRIELHVEKMIPSDGSITTAFQYRLSGGKVGELAPKSAVDVGL
jgi:hypothetical protein